MQTWPLLAKPLQTAACAARGRSASASTIIGDLPPSSSTAGTRRAAAACATCLPVAALPVKKIMSAAAVSAAPASPRPAHHLEDVLGQARLARQLGHAQRRQRRVLGRLQHDRVARDERRDAVGVVVEQRPVPRPDDGDDAARVLDDARPLVGEQEGMAQVVGAARAARPAPCSSGSARACRRARCPPPRSAACRSRRRGCRRRSRSSRSARASRRRMRAALSERQRAPGGLGGPGAGHGGVRGGPASAAGTSRISCRGGVGCGGM